MTYLWIYLASLAAFLFVDAVWLTTVMRPLFDNHVGALLRENMRLEAAAGFYALYIVGIIYFATSPALRSGQVTEALLKGAFLGFLAYGTYEATNMTTLKGWTWSMVATDTGWGMFLTAMTAGVGYLVGRALGVAPG